MVSGTGLVSFHKGLVRELPTVRMRPSFIFMMLASLHLRSAGAERSVLSEEEDMVLERKLKVLNKTYVKSFKVIFFVP